MYTNANGSATDGTMTQAAIKAAIGQSSASSENVTILASNWSSNTVTLAGDSRGYYSNSVNLTSVHGDHPTISLIATNPYDIPTPEQREGFNNISFVMVNGNTYTFYAKRIPQSNLAVNIKT